MTVVGLAITVNSSGSTVRLIGIFTGADTPVSGSVAVALTLPDRMPAVASEQLKLRLILCVLAVPPGATEASMTEASSLLSEMLLRVKSAPDVIVVVMLPKS